MFEAPEKYALRKTSEEKMFLRNISALERSYAEEKDQGLKTIYASQLSELKKGLSTVSTQDNAQKQDLGQAPFVLQGNKQQGQAGQGDMNLQQGAMNMGQRAMDSVPIGQKNKNQQQAMQPQPQKEGPSCESNLVNCEMEQKFLRAIIERHAEAINETEKKTVGGIKALVTKDDLTVKSLAESFSGEGYVFEKGYLAAAEKAYEYMRKEIATLTGIDLGVSFWLTPKEMVLGKFADDEDKAILLCSILYCLGDEKAEVVIAELENGGPHAFVITDFNNEFLLLDPSGKKAFAECRGMKTQVLKDYSFNGSAIRRFLYKFSHANYEQF